jgi:ribosomal protein S21
MHKKKKEHLSVVPGTPNAVAVVESDIKFALRLWKAMVKESNVLFEYKSRTQFEKPSITKRKMKTDAIFLQQIKSRNENKH